VDKGKTFYWMFKGATSFSHALCWDTPMAQTTVSQMFAGNNVGDTTDCPPTVTPCGQASTTPPSAAPSSSLTRSFEISGRTGRFNKFSGRTGRYTNNFNLMMH
jgi:hypothetical protein